MFNLATSITTAHSDHPFAALDPLLRFGLAQDRRYDVGAIELFESSFTEDAIFDFRPAARKCGIEVPLMIGRQMITDIIMSPSARLDTTHTVTNPRINVHGRTAEMTALVEAQHLPTGNRSRHALLKNYYAVQLQLGANDLWQMSRVYVECVWFTGDPKVITGG